MPCRTVLVSVLLVTAFTMSGQGIEQSRPVKGPETFSANAQAKGGGGAVAAYVRIHIDAYTGDKERRVMEEELKLGGYPSFLAALRKAPAAGYVEVGDQKWIIRWASQKESAKGRTIVVATDKPMFFVGGGRADAKPRAGYEMALIQLDVDDIGLGTGTMAAAAKVKPGGPTGVQVDDYGGDTPIKLISVSKLTSSSEHHHASGG